MNKPVVTFVAPSGTGKTTLLEKVIVVLKAQGVRVGAIKHDAHRFEIDHPGKDSYRFTHAGADITVISSSETLALVKRQTFSPTPEELIAAYFDDVDLILVEGFKNSTLPKIEVHRLEGEQNLICRGAYHDPNLLAVVSDEPLQVDVPVLDLNNPAQVAEFIITRAVQGMV